MGFVADSYAVGARYDFTRMMIPIDGRYVIRMKTYTYRAGPNGADGGNVWDIFGTAVSGPRVGVQLDSVQSYTAMWSAWVSHFDTVELYL